GGESLRRVGEARPDIELKVLLKVSERLRSNNEQILTMHVKGLESANRAKDEYLAMLGHELRNPLGGIRLGLHLLGREGVRPGEAARRRGVIGRQTRHLARLVEDLLDVSRLASGKVVLQRRAEDLKELIGRAVATFDQLGKSTRHVVTVSADDVRVPADATRMEQVVSNLLDNAFKYTPAGGRIDVALSAEGDDAVLRVRDGGVGIEADMLPRIFDPFVQGHQTPDRSAGGLGLGLTLVKRLVELHGGTVSV